MLLVVRTLLLHSLEQSAEERIVNHEGLSLRNIVGSVIGHVLRVVGLVENTEVERLQRRRRKRTRTYTLGSRQGPIKWGRRYVSGRKRIGSSTPTVCDYKSALYRRCRSPACRTAAKMFRTGRYGDDEEIGDTSEVDSAQRSRSSKAQ